jgi:hypothetical protein
MNNKDEENRKCTTYEYEGALRKEQTRYTADNMNE